MAHDERLLALSLLLDHPDTVLLDIRTPEEYAAVHLEGAILVPTPSPPLGDKDRLVLASRLRQLTALLPKSTPIVIYCRKGIRASLAKSILQQLGFVNVYVLGGVEVWPLSEL